ncbi:MAG: holo-ACP synthase [Nanoarchaeota archaeon]|nr:holo-ACP synthase [Nanoarchaeota archaeon]MBU1850363.1 holo-ACP synthase [Nanoarchaeota archaeon]
MNEINIGIDIESISRFKNLDRKKNKIFLNKIFTKKELEYSFSKKKPSQHLAVRFATKEAIIKAINSLGEKAPNLNKISIEKNINDVPLVNLEGYNIKVSLSHCDDKAIAFAIVNKIE